jgi:hypothetical protein
VNDLAAYYKRQGLKVEGPRGENQIIQKLVEVLALSRVTINKYLVKDFHQLSPNPKGDRPSVPASQRIEKALGPEVAERFRREVLEESKSSPEERALPLGGEDAIKTTRAGAPEGLQPSVSCC